MRNLAFAFFTALSLTTARADILANGDFHDGKAHWKGDLHEASDSDHYDTSSINQTGGPSGVIVDLAKGGYPRIYQVFNSHDETLNYSVTYQLSADYAPKPPPPGAFHVSMALAPNSPPVNDFLSFILGGPYSGDLKPPAGNDFLLLVIDITSATYSVATIHPTSGSTDAQTATGVLAHVPAHDEKTVYLIFSGGKGSVTLLNVALTPIEAAPNP
jgi:hypothetical protein